MSSSFCNTKRKSNKIDGTGDKKCRNNKRDVRAVGEDEENWGRKNESKRIIIIDACEKYLAVKLKAKEEKNKQE